MIQKSAILLGAVLLCLLAFSSYFAIAGGSVKCGTGRAPTRQLGFGGENWRIYCRPCVAALRTFARNEVIDTLEESARMMAKSHPQTRIVFGEIGFPNGGRFRPHRSHREGLSVDVMVPLKNGQEIETAVTNRYGYDVEFDRQGRSSSGEIDFDALAAHILALADSAKKRGGDLRRIFFAPDLQPLLFATPEGRRLRQWVPFNRKQSWVRHDDHIHIDFLFPCPKT